MPYNSVQSYGKGELVGKFDKLFTNILSGRKDQSIRFIELTHLLLAIGFMSVLMAIIIFITGKALRK